MRCLTLSQNRCWELKGLHCCSRLSRRGWGWGTHRRLTVPPAPSCSRQGQDSQQAAAICNRSAAGAPAEHESRSTNHQEEYGRELDTVDLHGGHTGQGPWLTWLGRNNPAEQGGLIQRCWTAQQVVAGLMGCSATTAMQDVRAWHWTCHVPHKWTCVGGSCWARRYGWVLGGCSAGRNRACRCRRWARAARRRDNSPAVLRLCDGLR
jgi:hypothetical protein